MDIAYIYPWRRVSGVASFPAMSTGTGGLSWRKAWESSP